MTELLKVRLQLPGPVDPARGPGWTDLWLREGTSDDAVLNEVWIQDTYHVRGLALAARRADTNPMSQVMNYPLVVDVGACTGLFSALVLSMFPDVQVLAVEPDRANFEILTLNTSRWRDRCALLPKAVGAHAGTTTLFGSHGTGYTQHDAHSDDGGQPVTQDTLADIIGDRPVQLLKIDTEGAEYDMLAACPSEVLARVDRIHMEWHGIREAPHVRDTPRRYGELLTKLAYTHSVQAFGSPDEGGMLYAHSNHL